MPSKHYCILISTKLTANLSVICLWIAILSLLENPVKRLVGNVVTHSVKHESYPKTVSKTRGMLSTL